MSNFLTSILFFTARRPDVASHSNAAQATTPAGSEGSPSVTPAVPLLPSTDELPATESSNRAMASSAPASGGMDEPSRNDSTQVPSDGPLPLVAYAVRRGEHAPSKARPSRALNFPRASSSVAMTSHAVPVTLTAACGPREAHPAGPVLTGTERVRLQVMQVQIRLTGLSLYDGPIDGMLNPNTVTGVRHFQTLKGMRDSGTLTAGTLSALGVPAIV